MPSPSTRLRAIALATICAGALGVAACGDDDEETTAADTTAATTETESADVSEVRDQFNEQLREVLITQNDLTEEQADCAIEKLNETIDDSQIEEANETGAPSDEVLEAAFNAGVECAE